MDQANIKNSVSKILSKLPKKMALLKHHHSLAECILYEISHELCLHLSTIAYIVYNPDFHLCKGIAGIQKSDLKDWCGDPFSNIDSFSEIIKESEFNKKIKKIEFCTIKIENKEEIIKDIQKATENDVAISYTWNLPNNNIGVLFYEAIQIGTFEKEDLEDAAGIMGFCPIG